MTTRTYVVSGGASGIGAATSQQLWGRRHRVITVDLHDADVVADLAVPAGRQAAIEAIGRLTDRVDGVVPCAGIAGLTGTDSRLVVSLNYFGAVALVEGLHPLMGPGSAAVLLSSNSVTCQPGWSTEVAEACLAGDEEHARATAGPLDAVHVYPATKAALAGWTRRRCVEYAAAGVRLNAVAPGLVTTPMTDRLREDPELGVFADAYPSALGRPGRPDEVAALITWLLSQEASLLVGAVVYADGGTDALLDPDRPTRP